MFFYPLDCFSECKTLEIKIMYKIKRINANYFPLSDGLIGQTGTNTTPGAHEFGRSGQKNFDPLFYYRNIAINI
jgi:hypothetical protein